MDLKHFTGNSIFLVIFFIDRQHANKRFATQYASLLCSRYLAVPKQGMYMHFHKTQFRVKCAIFEKFTHVIFLKNWQNQVLFQGKKSKHFWEVDSFPDLSYHHKNLFFTFQHFIFFCEIQFFKCKAKLRNFKMILQFVKWLFGHVFSNSNFSETHLLKIMGRFSENSTL